MWKIIAFSLAFMPHQAGQTLMFEGTEFGLEQRLTCQWFTNFENSRLDECRTATGQSVALDEGASIECPDKATCAKLDKDARRVANWRKPEPVWGFFNVEFYGRVSTKERQKQYLGDGTRTILITRLVSVRKRAGR